jgi:hypothetical protein
MADLQVFSDDELEKLAASEVGSRKKAVASEILRRRRRERRQNWLQRNAVIGGIVGAVTMALMAVRSWFRRP